MYQNKVSSQKRLGSIFSSSMSPSWVQGSPSATFPDVLTVNRRGKGAAGNSTGTIWDGNKALCHIAGLQKLFIHLNVDIKSK